MKRTKIFGLILVAMCVCSTAELAHGHYHPRLGRFIQRDPTGYVDGMNLYEYAISNPIQRVDPRGLWSENVHRDLTRNMMSAVCPQIAGRVADADQGRDENFHDAPSIVILGWLTLGINSLRPEVQEDYNYHFPDAGPPFPGQQRVVRQGFQNPAVTNLYNDIFNPQSRRHCDPTEFGMFLHMLQDSWSHGGGVPNWCGHPAGVRIVDNRGNVHITTGWMDTSVDNVNSNRGAYDQMKMDVMNAMWRFYTDCPCQCGNQNRNLDMINTTAFMLTMNAPGWIQ